MHCSDEEEINVRKIHLTGLQGYTQKGVTRPSRLQVAAGVNQVQVTNKLISNNFPLRPTTYLNARNVALQTLRGLC